MDMEVDSTTAAVKKVEIATVNPVSSKSSSPESQSSTTREIAETRDRARRREEEPQEEPEEEEKADRDGSGTYDKDGHPPFKTALGEDAQSADDETGPGLLDVRV